MSSSIAALQKTITSAQDLHGVVRTMKALAASSIVEYEQSERALEHYYATVRQGLGVCLRSTGMAALPAQHPGAKAVVVFGSDQGLVGRFNDVASHMANLSFGHDRHTEFWAVGERVADSLRDAGFSVAAQFDVPVSVASIGRLVGDILGRYEAAFSRGEIGQLHLVYNRTETVPAFAAVRERVLPLDESWQAQFRTIPWPGTALPELVGPGSETLSAFVREFLFVSLFRASAASLASENASRLAAMQRADRNIDGLLTELTGAFHRMRQDSIDAELFDVVAGYEALSEE